MAERGRRHKRLRPWLEAIVNSRDIPGLCWIDNDCTMFRIPWPHRNSQNWTADSGRVFMEWAIQTGKYREGVDKLDYATWKQRLRSAFAKAPDIEEVKSLHQQDSVTSPYKVYRLLPVESRQAATAAYEHDVNLPGSSRDSQAPRGLATVDYPFVVDMTPHGQHMGHGFNEPQNLEVPPTQFENWTPRRLSHGGQLMVNVFYCGNEVLRTAVKNGNGCLLCYTDDASPNQDLTTAMNYSQCDDCNLEMLQLPDFANSGFEPGSMHDRQGRILLEKGLRRALVINSNDQNDICAYRLCQCAVFYTSESAYIPSGNTQTTKLPRVDHFPAITDDTSTYFHKVFDYRNKFIPALQSYLDGCGPKPDPRVFFVFGQQVDGAAIRSRIDPKMLVVATVVTVQAVEDLRRAEEMSARTPSIEMSVSNEFDRLVHGAHSLHLETNPTYVPDFMDLKFSPTFETEQQKCELQQATAGASAMESAWEQWNDS